VSIRPFGTPLELYILIWTLSILMILVPPASDIFNFIDDLQSYPGNIFAFATTFGLSLIRHRRSKKMGIRENEFRAWNAAIIFGLVPSVFIIASP